MNIDGSNGVSGQGFGVVDGTPRDRNDQVRTVLPVNSLIIKTDYAAFLRSLIRQEFVMAEAVFVV